MSLLRLFCVAGMLTTLWATGSLLSACQTPAPPPSPATNDSLAGPSLPTSATAATLLRRAQSGPDVLLFPARGGGGHHHHTAPTTSPAPPAAAPPAAAPPAAAPSTTPAADLSDAGPTRLDADENAALHQGHKP
jgi:hypothetical protein